MTSSKVSNTENNFIFEIWYQGNSKQRRLSSLNQMAPEMIERWLEDRISSWNLKYREITKIYENMGNWKGNNNKRINVDDSLNLSEAYIFFFWNLVLVFKWGLSLNSQALII